MRLAPERTEPASGYVSADTNIFVPGAFWEVSYLTNRTNRQVALLAPHGGNIEPYTDVQVEHLCQLINRTRGVGADSWLCRGYKKGGRAKTRWHITSTEIAASSFPELQKLAGRAPYTFAIGFHGYTPMGRDPAVLIGGRCESRP
jgi:phage replication-related protein YjqB (UPF0714/DUF867 family)